MSEPQSPMRMRASDADRDGVLAVLQDAHAAGRLTLEDLAERQERALRATYTDELPTLVADLPEGRSLHGAGLAVPAAGRVPARPGPVRPATWSATVMTGREIELEAGAEGVKDIAWWGGNDIFLRDALGPGVTLTLELHAIMGGHTIYVPEGVRVVDESFAVMAGNDVKKGARGDGSNGTVVLRGFLFWGGSTVKLDKRQG